MNSRFSSGMPPGFAEATRLTGAGKLAEATALIQRLLNGTGGEAPAASAPASPSSTVIDVEPVHLDGEKPQAAPRPSAKFAGRLHPRPRTGSLPGLGETLRDLAARGMPAGFDIGGGSSRPASDPLPDGASFETRSHAGPAGTRDYKLYVPAKRTDHPMPLVVMLHGCTQSPDDFAAGTRMNAVAEELGVLVAYPAQPSSANAQKCWNWFKPEDQGRDRGEPSLIAGITRQIMRDHAVDPERVYVAGLSAGGATAAILGAAYPDLYAAIGVHSGLPSGAARDLPSAFAAMRQGAPGTRPGTAGGGRAVPTIVFHGDRDGTVHPGNGDAVAAQALAHPTAGKATLRATVERGRAPGGREFSRTVHADPSGRVLCEHWTIAGAGHAWAGGSQSGSYTDPAGPDATREMIRFFLSHRNGRAGTA
ncbi:PHB depolymerase family esterase [Skermanella mucosa]|uniref:extracellular catalytic domain type 1 short-chain-length polyhydroxyalkanoate depolymerase n=1 Tax=Skermanella mucosa TaxID=1789672 RepID=UPI00192B98FC|nr:PHB depolymerase family esterase [Skermanella mucosa]UEM20542.1 PHB depolymerase family esterase [Skermanella mucosa]